MTYCVTYIMPGGTLRHSRFDKAPTDAWVLRRGQYHPGCKALYAVRMWPSRRGWRIMDMREAVIVQPSNIVTNTYSVWKGYCWSERVYPSEDAAVMHAMAMSAALT